MAPQNNCLLIATYKDGKVLEKIDGLSNATAVAVDSTRRDLRRRSERNQREEVREEVDTAAIYFVNTNVPKFSGTWLGSRLVTQVGCQHMKRRRASGPSPSIR